MQTGKSITNLPLLIGIVLSVAAHAAALYARGVYTPPKAKLAVGQTVVQLTLVPSVASKAETQSAPPEPVEPEIVEEKVKEAPVEEIPEPVENISEPIPVPVPVPTPQTATQPPPQPVETAKETTPDTASKSTDSIEQIASLMEDKGVQIEAEPMQAIQPSYPRSCQRRGEEGTVVLAIQVLTSGKAGSIEIIKSSGHKRLDDAAVKAAQRAEYEPAKKFGRNVESKLTQPIVFKLTQN